jgi:outer membrane protein OmpA-like peptidoglycan-associated protein
MMIREMMLLAGICFFLSFQPALAEDLAFPTTEKEILDTLSFKEQTLVHNGQEYVSTKEGEVFMVLEGKRYRMKGIGGIINTALVPKAGALVTFDTNSARIKEESYKLIEQYGNVLQRDLPDAKIIIEGHTDDLGPADYNSLLSEERALSVKTYLINHFRISPGRVMIKGSGEARPIAPNDTPDGRSLNRRVEFIRTIE